MTDRVRWGVLGAAGIARMAIVPAMLKARNATLQALASRKPALARDWAAECGFAAVHDSYEALLADPAVDAVYIPLPNSLHAEWTIKAAEAGKAVLCEKPLALDARQAAQVIRACEKRGTLLMEGFMYQFHPQHERVRSLVRDGVIGDIVEVQAHLSVNLMEPFDPGNVRFAPALGGGTLLDMGCYAVHIARRLLGEEPGTVLASWRIDEELGVDLAGSALLEFPSGRTATMSFSFTGNGQGFYRVVGRKGVIDLPRAIIPGLDGRAAEAIIYVVDDKGVRKEEVLPPVDQYQLMLEAFSDAVLKGTPAPVPPLDALQNMLVLDAIAESARTGHAVSVSARRSSIES
jgi:xylose dehydrogenase (NAD/NADP)